MKTHFLDGCMWLINPKAKPVLSCLLNKTPAPASVWFTTAFRQESSTHSSGFSVSLRPWPELLKLQCLWKAENITYLLHCSWKTSSSQMWMMGVGASMALSSAGWKGHCIPPPIHPGCHWFIWTQCYLLTAERFVVLEQFHLKACFKFVVFGIYKFASMTSAWIMDTRYLEGLSRLFRTQLQNRTKWQI